MFRNMSTSLFTAEEKRQVRWFVMRAYKNEKMAEDRPVSYTHLDVYKRQPEEWKISGAYICEVITVRLIQQYE